MISKLTTTAFVPFHCGQLAFYVTAIERQLRRVGDGRTIDVLLIAAKDATVVEYALEAAAARSPSP